MSIAKKEVSTLNVISAMFLVAGTCIGGGMLALPIATGVSGFVPSTFIMVICWLAMTASALFLLEANLWLSKEAHIITISKTFLGPVGKAISWCLYLFICYASLVAYTAAGGSLVINSTSYLFQYDLSVPTSCLVFILLFGSLIYFGGLFVGRINAILFLAMIAAYVALMSTGISEINLSLLKHRNWSTTLLAIPILLTTFSFQTMLPSLTPVLKRNTAALRAAIIGGTTITFLIYLIWQWMVLGIIPISGPNNLIDALEAGQPVTEFLREHVNSNWVSIIAEYFAFFALVTSFLGIGLGLFDFLADGLKIKKVGKGKFLIALLVTIPTFFFASYFERIFLLALDATGGYGDTILNGIFPVLMVWMGRYVYKFPSENRTPGGKPLLIIVLAFFVFSFVVAILSQAGLLPSS